MLFGTSRDVVVGSGSSSGSGSGTTNTVQDGGEGEGKEETHCITEVEEKPSQTATLWHYNGLPPAGDLSDARVQCVVRVVFGA